MKNKLEVLKTIAKKFNEANIHYAVGASVLLFFKGIVNEFHDLDILIDVKDGDKVKHIFNELGVDYHTTYKKEFGTKLFLEYTYHDVDIDIIGGFTIIKDNIEYDCSLQKDIYDYVYLDDTKIALDTLENWHRYYALMGRDNKVKMIDEYKKDISTK